MRPVSKQEGFTLVESIVTILVTSIAILALSSAIGLGFRHSSDGLKNAKSVELAQAYLEEIQTRRYDEMTPLGGVPPCSSATTPCSAIGSDGESRSQFDDVDDYHGIDESPPLDATATPMPEFDGYRVQVAVAYASAAQVTELGLDGATDAKIVTVSVVTPGGETLRFPAVIGNY